MATDEQQGRMIARCRVWEHRMSNNVSIEVLCEVEVSPDIDSNGLIAVLRSLEDRFTPHLAALEAYADQTPPAEVVISFGKFRDRKVGEVMRIDPDYVAWLARDSNNYTVKRAAQRVIAQAEQAREVREPLPTAPAEPPPPGDEDLPF
jgi:hypothetical protein